MFYARALLLVGGRVGRAPVSLQYFTGPAASGGVKEYARNRVSLVYGRGRQMKCIIYVFERHRKLRSDVYTSAAKTAERVGLGGFRNVIEIDFAIFFFVPVEILKRYIASDVGGNRGNPPFLQTSYPKRLYSVGRDRSPIQHRDFIGLLSIKRKTRRFPNTKRPNPPLIRPADTCSASWHFWPIEDDRSIVRGSTLRSNRFSPFQMSTQKIIF